MIVIVEMGQLVSITIHFVSIMEDWIIEGHYQFSVENIKKCWNASSPEKRNLHENGSGELEKDNEEFSVKIYII